MQRQKKQFLILLLLLIIGVGAYIGIRIYNNHVSEQETAEEEASKITVMEEENNNVTEFSYQTDGETLCFVKEEEQWVYEADKSISLDQDAVESVLSVLTALTAEDEITDYESLADYGLKEPANVFTITTADGTTTLNLGDENSIVGGYYLQKTDVDAVYLVDSTFASSFEKTVADLTAEESTETEAATEE